MKQRKKKAYNEVEKYKKSYRKDNKYIIKYYNQLPKLNHYYCLIEDEKRDLYDEESGFSWKKLFAIENNNFKHSSSIVSIFRKFFGFTDNSCS